MTKRWQALVGLLIIALIAAGCSSSGSTNSEAGSTGSAKKTIVSVWALPEHTWIDGAAADFNSANADIQIEVSKYAVDPLKEALKVAANSGTLPNMWFTWGGSLGSFYAENGLTADLTQISKDHNWSTLYNQAAIDMGTYNGKVSGIPYHLNAVDTWYSKVAYDKVKLTAAPTSFEEFEAHLQTLKDGGITPLSLGGKNGWHVMRLTEQLLEHFAGPELHDKLNNLTASWNDPAVVQTFAKLKEYNDKGYFPKGYVALDPTEAVNLFYPGTTAIDFEGTWLDGNIAAAGFNVNDFDVFKFPTGRTSVFAEMFQVSADLDQATLDATVKVGEYLTSAEVVNKYIDSYGAPAALNVNYSENTPHLKPLLDMATKGSFLITDQALPQEVAQKLFEAQDKVALNEWTPEQAAEGIEKAAADYKAKNK